MCTKPPNLSVDLFDLTQRDRLSPFQHSLKVCYPGKNRPDDQASHCFAILNVPKVTGLCLNFSFSQVQHRPIRFIAARNEIRTNSKTALSYCPSLCSAVSFDSMDKRWTHLKWPQVSLSIQIFLDSYSTSLTGTKFSETKLFFFWFLKHFYCKTITFVCVVYIYWLKCV